MKPEIKSAIALNSFPDMLAVLRGWLQTSPESARLWDLLTCLRGPDSPSETGRDNGRYNELYKARRARKRKTVEVIRGQSKLMGGSCRWRDDVEYVTLPKDSQEWDHFDRHVHKAALALGLTVKYE